jgi:hypothetical protein
MRSSPLMVLRFSFMHLSLALQEPPHAQNKMHGCRAQGSRTEPNRMKLKPSYSLARDEADELGDALLDGLLGVLGHLAVLRHGAARRMMRLMLAMGRNRSCSFPSAMASPGKQQPPPLVGDERVVRPRERWREYRGGSKRE